MLLWEEHPDWTMSKVAKRVGMPVSTAFDFIWSLRRAEIVRMNFKVQWNELRCPDE